MKEMNLERMEKLKQIYNACRAGEDIYEILKQDLREGTGVIYSPANVGDTVWLAALAAEYKKHYGYEKLLFIVREKQADMLELFPEIDATIPIDENTNICLRYYIMVQRLYFADNIRYGHFPSDVADLTSITHCLECESDKLEHMWDTVLGLPFNTPKSTIKLEKPTQEARDLFQKAVLLMPGSFTIRGIPAEFWAKLSEAIKGRGYQVYTNYSGSPCDIAIANTERLETSLKEIANISPCFKMIIGIRSGICDLLSMTGCNLKILYPAEAACTQIRISDGERNDDVQDLSQRSRNENFWCNQNLEKLLLEELLKELD